MAIDGNKLICDRDSVHQGLVEYTLFIGQPLGADTLRAEAAKGGWQVVGDDDVCPLCRTCPSLLDDFRDRLKSWSTRPVGHRVGSVRSDGATLIEPVP
jgi:hypothetical protein